MVARIVEFLVGGDILQRETSIRHALNGCIRYTAVNQHLLGEIIADAQIVYITEQVVGEGLVRIEVKRNAGRIPQQWNIILHLHEARDEPDLIHRISLKVGTVEGAFLPKAMPVDNLPSAHNDCGKWFFHMHTFEIVKRVDVRVLHEAFLSLER